MMLDDVVLVAMKSIPRGGGSKNLCPQAMRCGAAVEKG
jgi:hypothetical protein